MRTLLVLGLLFTTAAAGAGEPETTNPIPYVWVATTCETWICAITEMSMAHGDPSVLVLPTSSERYPWIVIRRLAGSVYLPEEPTFEVECFEKMADASRRYDQIASVQAPLMVSTRGGVILVACLREVPPPAKRRSVSP